MDPELSVSAPQVDARSYHSPASHALSGAEYRALVEQSYVMIWRADVDGRCDYLSETWLAFTGRTAAQEIGTGWAESIHPDDLEKCIERYRECCHNRERFELEYRVRRHDGVYRWMVGRANPYFDEHGALKGFIGSTVDIDDRRRAQAERERHHQETLALYEELRVREARIRRLIDANIVGVVFSDPDSQLVEANDAFLDLLGYSRDDMTAGRLRWRELTPVEWKAASERAAAQLRETGSCDTFEKEYFRKDGSRVPVLIGAAAVGDERKEIVAFVLDITERKRAEQERQRLRQAQAELAYMSRILTMGELAASISHEIKQPIIAALASAETCVRWLERPVPDLGEVREAAARMSVEVRRTSQIVDRLRSLYTKGEAQRDSVDVNHLVTEMVALLDHEASRRAVALRTELEPMLPAITGDRVQLQQVLLNLMLNAIEASKGAAGETLITTQRMESSVLISVKDSGAGLPTEHADRIFEAFFTTKPQGTGMGLAVSRAIVESHGGRLWATANADAGATFQFTLPN